MNTLEWLRRLVAFDTTSRLSNLALVDELKNYLAGQQISCRLTFNTEKTKANLLAILPDANGNEKGGLILSGHTDVVPVDGQSWEGDPFTVRKIGNHIYGRGTCDMKGFLAVLLAMVPAIQKMKLTRPIYLAFSYDEEVGCQGAPHLIADMEKIGLSPSACLVGEPTEMHPIVAHKGIQVLRATFKGLAAHSSLTPIACNALEYAARLVNYLRAIADELKRNGPFDQLYDVPFSTVSTNLIRGGNAYNTIPAACEIVFEFRHLPLLEPKMITDKIHHYIDDELLPAMRREYPEAAITVDVIASAPAFSATLDNDFVKIITEISHETPAHKVAYATEAGLFQGAAIPTLVLGPGSIREAHKANEFITTDQLTFCQQFLEKLIKKYCEGSRS